MSLPESFVDAGRVFAASSALEHHLPQLCRLALEQVWILPRRMQLDTGRVYATVPMLRGVWGRAMREHFPELYSRVFHVPSRPGPVAQGPPYLLRPAPPDADWAPAVEWILIGKAIDCLGRLLQCWQRAGSYGLGSKREPFRIVRQGTLRPDGAVSDDPRPWSLAQAVWPCASAATPCRLELVSPLRLRHRSRLVERPTLVDLVASLVRRLGGMLPERYQPLWLEMGQLMLRRAEELPARSGPWHRQHLVRYSAAQKQEVELYGVVGTITLPEGAQQLTPLLAAAQWVHVGKATVFGLGQLEVHPLDRPPRPR